MNDYPLPINENIMCIIKEKMSTLLLSMWTKDWTQVHFQVKNKLKYDTSVKCEGDSYYWYIYMTLLVQENPSLVYPVLQEQVWLPSVLLQVA